MGRITIRLFLVLVIIVGLLNLLYVFNKSHFIFASLSDPISDPISQPITPTATPTATLTPTPIPFIVTIDNGQAGFSTVGIWKESTAGAGYIGLNYLHDQNNQKGKKSARWTPNLAAGTYKISVRYVSSTNRASNVPYVITHSGGSSTVYVDQRVNGGQWVNVGTYSFLAGTSGYIEVRTTSTNGYVIADAVLFEQVFQ